jgi:hypothetical protein
MENPQQERKRFALVVDEEDGYKIKVYPLAYHVLEQHADAVAFVLNSAMRMDAKGLVEAAASGDGSKLWTLLAPFAGRQILQMVNSCCVPTLAESYAAPDVVAEACGKWIELSFLRRGSYDRLIKTAESLAKAATGESLDLRSRLQSLLASASPSSQSTTVNGGTGTPAEDGQSRSGSNAA